MSKMIILEGNSNDKDNVRAYMVKGEPGNDGVSPTVATSKTGSVTTVTFTDAEGTHTATINDGEIQKSDVIDVLTSLASQKPLSANQGRVLKSLVDTKANASDCYTKTEIDQKIDYFQQQTVTATGVVSGVHDYTNQHITVSFKRIGNTVFLYLILKIDGDENATDEDDITLFEFADQNLSGYGVFSMPNFAKTNEQFGEGENAIMLSHYSDLDFSTVGITRFAKGYFAIRNVNNSRIYLFKGNCTYNKKYGASFGFYFSYPVVN